MSLLYHIPGELKFPPGGTWCRRATARRLRRSAWAMLLCLPLGLMGIITPYGTGPSPIYYGCGYIPGKDFWRLGLILGVLFFLVYVTVGVPWLRFLEM